MSMKTSFSAWAPSAVVALRSATTLRSLLFLSSSCFSRRISVGSRPSYFFFQLN